MSKRSDIYYIAIAFVVLLLVSLACGSSNEGSIATPVVEEHEQQETPTVSGLEPEEPETEEPEQEEPQPSFEVFEVGDLIEVEDHTIRLNSVEYQGDVLVANFVIENLGSSDLNVSSMMSFSAKREDGTQLDQEIFDCGTSNLDGTVLPSDRLRGDICWSGASPDDGIRIYYEANLFASGAVVWNAVEGVAEPLDTGAGTAPEIELFQIGDLIEVQDHTIRLNSLEYQGNVLVADFTIENHGGSDLDISSMMSFSAKKEDGTLLDQEIFDCGTSSLDGKVLPGDRLRGSICWSEASPDSGIRIYYEASMFGEGAIVWDAIEGVAEPLEVSDAELEVDISRVGDVVQVQDHTIVLNSVEFRGNVLQANFTLENQGASDLEVSSMLSFYARKRDGSGLEQEIFDCGTSLDGSVIPGDIFRGDICWSGFGPDDGIKIYYESDLFGDGAVVWVVD
ncbi:MAG: hypothetical protein SWK90_17515 [Chloroflexota bacterium]|nr:hypothetical protein [Chloroflexota bacterium]